ncbi:Down syndrome cell adhesion molecule-like protein Dscam2 [Vanessa cardui]|uniref:Down syndrome cell adhesion molecule-like protein Dscam2 n=1 Tax=Vanessa cardui TaxID=171605 RepID=UPI001F13F5EE|nr:Down syndrome cell adhesion molecule-like protein Dscam2 [Vanessa cardui]
MMSLVFFVIIAVLSTGRLCSGSQGEPARPPPPPPHVKRCRGQLNESQYVDGDIGSRDLREDQEVDLRNFLHNKLIQSDKEDNCFEVNAAYFTCDSVKKMLKEAKKNQDFLIWCSLVKKTNSVRIKRKRLKRSSDSRPELVYTFIEQAVQPGAQVALKCSAVGEPPPRFRWSLDGQPIPSHHGAIITEGRETGPSSIGSSNNYILSTLSLNSARVEHGGRYECRATNNHGSIAHAARLNVYGPPYIRAMNPVKAVAGSDVTIWCPYYGFPIDSVKWEGGVANDPRYQQSEGQLTITNVDRTRDRGGWICSVLTPGGELARREVQINVVSPPVLSPIVFPPGLRAGDRSQLTCTVTSGDMPVYFSWLKDQMPISSVLQVDERGAEFYSMLLFKSLTAAHSGVYTCVVTNTAGKANMSAELAIKVPPYWQIEPLDGAVLLNGSLTVSCEARGHPSPAIYWTKFTGSTETALGGVSDPVVLGNGSLRLESARADHSGKYRCRAENGVAPALSKTLTIHVNEPARFETPSVNVTAKLGDTVRLACVARGDNPLSMTWSHSGRALPNSDYRMSISETRSAEGLRSELVIERADRRDSGVYRCQASNPYGRSDHFVHLGVQEPPEPPANFRVLDTTSRSIRLQWRRPYDGNSPVLGYVVQYRRHDSTNPDAWRDADTHNVSVNAHTMDSYTETEDATITGLEPATAYLVRARTVTAQFASAHTRALLALTSHEPPARAPVSLRASAPRPSTIELAWQAPPTSAWNGELLGYTVWWWPAADGTLSGGASVGMEFATVRGHVTKYTIESLEHFTRYSVSVRAFNSAGAGPATAPVNTLTQESVPSEGPRAVRCRAVSPQSLKVEWSPPPAHAHHGALLGYKLLYRPEHTTDWLEWEVRGGGGGAAAGAEVKRVAGVETLLLALRPHSNYTVQALAYTAAGDGVPAHPIHCTTQQDAPGPPAAVKVIATSVTSLAVSWLPPGRPNGPILYYTVFYRELGRDRPPQTTTVQAEDVEMAVGLGGFTELRSLSESATYEAWVAAHSAAGEGEPSAPQPATTTSRAAVRLLSFGVWARVQCGRPLRLACAWRGEPAPRARWLRGDRPVTHDPRTHLTPHGHLAIHEVDALTSGNYTCSARNSFGSEEVTYRVECAAPPAAPALALERASHTLARLAWRTTHHPAAPPHGFTIFWVRVRDDSGEGAEPTSSRGEEERKIEAGGEAASVVLRALSCGATYSVKAVAHSRAGSSPPSAPLLVRTKPPVLVWEGGGNSESDREEGAEAAVWSNSSALALDARRAVRCSARLVRLQWRRADAGLVWRDADLTSLHHHREVVIGGLAVGTWYALKLWTATDSSRQQAVIYAATTTHSGERLRRPVAFQTEGIPTSTVSNGDSADRVLGALSLAFAALAALAVSALLLVLMAKRSTLLSCGDQIEEETRRCSHSAASTDKSVCPEQQNIRNCQHDYKHDKLSPASDVYEISPYATFAVGGETAATLDHTLQFRTFGHRDNDAPPHRPCRKHPQRHRERADVEKHHSDCELQQLSRYEKVRPRHCAGTSYCVPLSHHGGGGGSGGGSGGGFSEVYAGDSSAESGPGSLSPRTHHEHS